MMFCRFLLILFALGPSSAFAQFGQKQAETLVETLLSTQNPLVVVTEIAHGGLVSTAVSGGGYRVQVQAPRLPGRTAFGENLEFTLMPQTADLIQVRVSNIQPTFQTQDAGALSFTPTVFTGLYSLADQGFESLKFSMEDLAYAHPDLRFSLDVFDLDMRREAGKDRLTFNAQGYAADLQDVVDAQETVGSLSLTLTLPENQTRAGDLLHLTHRVFEALVGTNVEEAKGDGDNAVAINASGKARALPTDLRGLSFDMSLRDWAPKWMALRDNGTREIMSDSQIPHIAVRGEVVPMGQGLADVVVNVGLDGMQITAPDGILTANADAMGLTLALRGIESAQIGDLFAKADGVQSAAFGAILGSFNALEVQATAANLAAASPAQAAQAALSGARFDFHIRSPRPGAPNSKDMALGLGLTGLDAAYPSLLTAFEPAWSTLLQPALPETFDLQMDVQAIPGDMWRGLAGMFVDPQILPQDTTTVTAVPSLTLDGTQYISDLVNAKIDGTLTFAPGASLFAVGDVRLEISNLRPLIAAMQRSARVPDRTIAQFLTLGSVGLATIAGFAVPAENGNALFVFEFQQDGFPTINGRPLPVGF